MLEWNGHPLTGKSQEEIDRIMSYSNGEIELVIRAKYGCDKKLLFILHISATTLLNYLMKCYILQLNSNYLM